MTKLQLIPKTS